MDANQGAALDQLVPGGRKEPALGQTCSFDRVARPTNTLQRHPDRTRRADLAHQVDRPDVDPELERGRRDDRAQVARLQLSFGRLAELARKTPVVSQHGVGPQTLLQMMGHPLGEPTGVDEDEGRPMGLDELGHPVVDLRPHFVGGNDSEILLGHLDRDVELPVMTRVDDGRGGAFSGGRPRKKLGDVPDRIDRGREPNSLRP